MMNVPWYVWLLLSLQIASFLFFFLQKPKKKQEQTAESHEDKIFQLYTQIEDMLDSFEEYVGEVHTGLEEKRQEIIELNRQAQVVYMQAIALQTQQYAPPPAPPPVETPPEPIETAEKPRAQKTAKKEAPSRLTDKDKEALGRFATKPQKVRYLMSRGLSLDEVAKELDIGRGEVILIADLDKT